MKESPDLSEGQETQLLQKIESAGVSGMRARDIVKALIELDISSQSADGLIQKGVINVTGTGRYYCSSPTNNKTRKDRRYQPNSFTQPTSN